MKNSLALISRAQLLAMAGLAIAAISAPVARGGGMHEDVDKRTYSDFGQNKGRFRVTGISSMLQAIREKDGGIAISKANGEVTWVLPEAQGMINFAGSLDYGATGTQCHGAAAAFGSNYLVTVAHNPGFSASFGVTQLGSAHSIKYSTVQISEKDLMSAADWGLYRQNKIYTDVVGAYNYSGVSSEQQDSNENGIPDIKEQLEGELMYRAFAGGVVVWGKDGKLVDAGTPYTTILGGISTIRAIAITTEGLIFGDWNMKTESSWVNESAPLPTNAQGGDSGSPVYVYNQEAGRYEYIFSLRAGNATTYSVAHGSIDFANQILDTHSVEVDMSTTNTAQLGAVANGSGLVTVGNTTYEHLAVNSGSNTWKDLSAVKDNANWYAYGNHYQNGISGLGNTQNLIFTGNGGDYDIILNATVDTGVGYLEFNNGSFTIKNAEGGDYTLNSAGYVINEGAEVHVQLTNPSSYMREWRKNGAGDLYIEGEGDNNILLAVGGSGTTYLDRQNGHAAYNVLASSGATVVISDTNQIERAFTFGLNGGTLDMNGNSMDWYTTNSNIEADGFSINALTDDALIINSSGTTTMTYKQAGNSVWKGSLKDSANGSLSVIADMGAGSVWTMNSICTDLSNNTASSFTVKSGTVVLAGINTEHGTGSVPYSDAIFFSEDDWHYADAKMNVTVENGATFQLGTHARVKGDITVNTGGTYVMNEGVHHQMEYIEGGIIKENTQEWAEYYGHQGNTTLAGGALKVEFADRTTATHTYGGNITGEGTVTVNVANSILNLIGNNTFTGSRSVIGGTLMVEDAAAAGNEKWYVGEKGALAAHNADGNTALNYIDSDSNGVLALTQNQLTQVDTSGHKNLIIGALAGQTIQYGEQGTTDQLAAIDNAWRLGGGGGNLVVNYVLTGDNKLILGNAHTKGVVTLANSGNNFTGGIDFMGTGVTLDYTNEDVIRNISLNLSYGNRVAMSDLLSNITGDSNGILLQRKADQDLDMTAHQSLFLGAEGNLNYTGKLQLAEGEDYRFSAANGTLTIAGEVGGNRNLIIDAQGYTGGTVKLEQLNDLNGNVTVMGQDSTKTANIGNITLRIEQDNALDSAECVTLKAGGTLHIGDSTQHISNLVLEEGSSLLGNRLESSTDLKASELHITIDSMSDIKGLVNVDTIHKYGSNTLELNNGVTSATMGNLRYRALYIEEGDVKLTATYSNVGSLYLGDSTLHLNGKNLNLGTVIAGDRAVIDASASGSTIGGNAIITVASGTATLSNGTNTVTVGGRIGAYEGATLKLTGSGDWKFTNFGYNLGGTLRIEDASKIAFSYGTNGNTSYNGTSPTTQTVTVSGTLDLADSVTHIQSAANCHVQELDFNTIKLNGQNLTLEETTQQAVWRIRNLEASEDTTITWNASHTTTSNYRRAIGTEGWEQISETNSSRLILNGENSFTGKIIANRTTNGAAYNSYVELAHDKALQHGTLELNGYEGSTMSLAVNTNNARIKGLTGNEHSLAYSGESSRINLDSAPTGDGKNTLTITGSGSYDYKGAVNGLNIAMDGTGTQIFSGNNIKAQNISALSGRLEFTQAPTVADTISIAQGATLKLSDSYSLNNGVTLALIAGSNGSQGTLEGTLILNGGTLEFDSTALNDATSLLNANIQYGEDFSDQAVSFSNHLSLEHGATYNLLSGDWSGRNAILADNMPDYLAGSTFTADGSGLKVTVRFADGITEWQDDYAVFSAGETVLFRDREPSQTLQFTSTATAGGLRFTNNETYSFSGSDITLSGDLNVESGKLVLNNKLTAADYTAAEGELVIADSGTLVLTNTQESTATVSNISGTGTLQIKLDTTDNTYNNKLAIDEDFEGTTHVTVGNLTLTDSSFGNTLKLAGGVNAQITAKTTIDGNLELEGKTEVHQNSGNQLIINGDVTGSNGTWDRRGGGTLDVNGSVSLAGFDTGSNGTTSNFNGTTSISTVTLDQENITANFNGNATVETLNPSGNNVTLGGTGTLSVGNFNLTGGKSVTIDGLSIAESSARTRSWNNNTITLKNGASLDSRQSYYNHSSGNLTIGGSDANGTMYVKGLCLMPNDTAGVKSVLTVSSGAHLIIAGENGGTTTSDFVLAVGGEYSQLAGSNQVNVSGTLTSNAAMTLYYKSADVTIQAGGRMNLLSGLELKGSAYNEWVSGGVKANLQVQEGGQLYAAGGTQRSELVVSLASGTTLGAIGSADSTVTFKNNMTVGTADKEGTFTVDTAATTADDNLLLTRSETKGVTVDMTGSLNLQGNTAVEVIGGGTLRHKNAFNNATAIRVREGATLAVDSGARLTAATELSKSSISLDSAEINGSGITVTDAATIRATGGNSAITAATTLTNESTLTYDVAEGATLQSTGALTSETRSDLVKIGTGSLQLNNAANRFDNIRVDAGELMVHGAVAYDLDNLQAATSASLGFYAGAVGNAETEAAVRVSGTADFGSGAQLNANLTLATGAVLSVADGGLSMGSSVTLEQGILLSDAVLARADALSAGEKLTLFSGVDSLILGNGENAKILNPGELISGEDALASGYFSNLRGNLFELYFSGTGGDGTVGILAIPEPSLFGVLAGTLSLAFAFSRRRKRR